MSEFTPVFNFDGEGTSAEQVAAMLAESAENTRKPSKIFREGTHDLIVSGVELKGSVAGDAAWMKVLLRFNGTEANAGKAISTLVLVPTTARLTYDKEGAESSIYPFQKLSETMSALGITLTRDNVKSIIPQYFAPANLKVLEGRTTIGTVGYRGAHAQGQRDQNGGREVVLINFGEAVKDDTGTVMVFSGDDAYANAEAYAKKIGLNFASFPDLISLEQSADNAQDSTGTDW